MIKNYFITGLRTLIRNRAYAIINVLGLAIGMAFALVIYLLANHELSYNQMLPDLDRLYRVVLFEEEMGEIEPSDGTPFPLRKALREHFDEAEASAQIVRR